MRSMIWHPEEKDQKVNTYLDRTNHAPYGTIIALLIVGVCLFTFVVLFGMV
ncbi:unknown protein [Stanieria sp. NIES-3757]|nr:unknown protein [Stanieria sp. NIES-3757]